MAVVKIPAEQVTLTDQRDVTTFLAVRGIDYERWVPSRQVAADASAEEVIAAYAYQIEALKARGGYVTADVIDVNPDTPNLDAMLATIELHSLDASDPIAVDDANIQV